MLRNKLESSSKMVATLQAKIAEMEAVEDLKDTIERQAMQAEQVRAVVASFSAEQDALFQVDTTCVGYLGTLAKPRVLAPCGHTVCGECIASMDRAAAKQVGIFAGEKFCPVCEFPEGEGPSPSRATPTRCSTTSSRAVERASNTSRPSNEIGNQQSTRSTRASTGRAEFRDLS